MATAKKTWSLKKVMSKEKNLVWPWPWKLSTAFKRKRFDFQMQIIDKLVFKIMYIVEAIVLVSTVCFFFLCCGCQF